MMNSMLSILMTILVVGLLQTAVGKEPAKTRQDKQDAQQVTLKVVPTESSVDWTGRKVTGRHHGNIKVQSGQVTVKGTTLTDGNFVIDMTTLSVGDLEGEGKAKLTNHLKSDDFFSVASHPTASFDIKKVTPIKNAEKGSPNMRITGDLTIKGKTRSIDFPATVWTDGNTLHANAQIEVDRSKFDVKYGSGSFFGNLGDKMIYDVFTLAVHLKAAK